MVTSRIQMGIFVLDAQKIKTSASQARVAPVPSPRAIGRSDHRVGVKGHDVVR
jgi:hypothetical protein